ncbi:MAG: ABC transporter permease subunit [Puniceicoccaceae bacterium]
MNVVIVAGGIGVIMAVFAIFAFIMTQIVPLFGGAKVSERGSVKVQVEAPVLMGIDEWGELPFILNKEGRLFFVDLQTDLKSRKVLFDNDGSLRTGERGIFEAPLAIEGEHSWESFRYDSYSGTILLASDDSTFATIGVSYKPNFAADGTRSIEETVVVSTPFRINNVSGSVVDLDFYRASERQLIGAIVDAEDQRMVVLQPFNARRSLFGTATMDAGEPIDLTGFIEGEPLFIRTGGSGDRVIVVTKSGKFYYFAVRGQDPVLMQTFEPFKDQPGVEVKTTDWLFGRVSLVVTTRDGQNVVLSSFLDRELEKIQYALIRTLEPFGNGANLISHSLRNRAFLLQADEMLSLRYATTENIRWEKKTDYQVAISTLGPKYDSILALDTAGRLHVYNLRDPHPEAGIKAFFGKIWYEGQAAPGYQWQSTGGESSFESKLSIVPLFFGSIKGTLYAMMFAVPIAILAAVYTSQFLSPEMRRIIKPTMEIMASLPSVVLGFLAALWLAPIMADRVPSVLMICILVPLVSLLIGYFWGKMPQGIRMHLKPGREFWVMIPTVLLVGFIGWSLGPIVESIFFGGDFRAWWPQATGASYEQRNALVVGFMVGFAVIPIIFTISEDALSNVPPYLTSASLALGASRWQTAWMVVLPTGSPGIFSALMIGLGRAVGETMIFLMATGNTAVMDWNIFNGMRTLAANIAVELPEAPEASTLYRTLFLGAMALFLLTFAINTIAEVTRQRLREKFKTI